MDVLSDLATSHYLHMWQHPLGTDKESPHNYLSGLYSRKFVSDHEIRSMLEIGFAHCASLALWSIAFPDAEIFGVDINECLNPHPKFESSKNVSLVIANAYGDAFVSKLNKKFDLIIDDGPHSLESQINAIQLYSGLLNPHGMLVIEDVAHGLGTARKMRKSCPKVIAKHLVFYDFRSRNNHFDNCLVVYYENFSEAKTERRHSSTWDQFAFAFPVRLPSKYSLTVRLRKFCKFLGLQLKTKADDQGKN